VIVTDDNPRSEDPAAIRAAVLAGTRDAGARVLEIGDRRAAIAEGVRQAAGGTLLVAGKGHERGQEIAGTVLAFDDREVLAAVLAGVRAGAPNPDTSLGPHPADADGHHPTPGQEAP
jgi:UDP-N-acetylmuramoyl-L-alanyl-D-glutamate--2,6-diaminopimelate ligase